MYCILLDSTRPHFVPFLKFLLENKPNDFQIVEYNQIDDINWGNLEKYDYVLHLSRFCYIDFAKLTNYLSTIQPTFAGLSTYWGVGFPYLAIMSNKVIKDIITNYENYNKYFEDTTENLYINILLQITGLSDIKELLSKSEEELKQIYLLHNIVELDNQCYLNNIEYTKGWFHNSVFVAFSDTEDRFIDFLTEYNSKQKFIRFKQKPYKLEIGKQFFVIKNYHIGIIDPNTIVFWDRASSSWKKAGVKLFKKISTYINKKFDLTLDSKPS